MKERMLQLIYCPAMPMLVIAALLLGLAPFVPEPHLLQKANMLLAGQKLQPLDVFDMFWHGWPLLWIALRLVLPAPQVCCRVS